VLKSKMWSAPITGSQARANNSFKIIYNKCYDSISARGSNMTFAWCFLSSSAAGIPIICLNMKRRGWKMFCKSRQSLRQPIAHEMNWDGSQGVTLARDVAVLKLTWSEKYTCYGGGSKGISCRSIFGGPYLWNRGRQYCQAFIFRSGSLIDLR